ncbi:hypothetical protein EDB84DRAFT_544772 [Lactarius hengduanensis]|nr:hypothetical protein EDB84DRAFT_544772 [Lactarius hengduanensis]
MRREVWAHMDDGRRQAGVSAPPPLTDLNQSLKSPIRLMRLCPARRSPACCAQLTRTRSSTRARMAYAGLGAGTHTITSTIVHTWTHQGLAEFYRGLATNLVRVPLGTCITFVVYENIVWLLKHAAARRKAHQDGDEGSRQCIYYK